MKIIMSSRIHKQKRPGFGNQEERRIIRAIEKNESRRQRRSEVFAVNRQIDHITPSTSSVVEAKRGQPDSQDIQKEDRKTKLLRWKAEKELKKKIQRQLAQPAFRSGIYHRKLNSSVFLHQSLPAAKPPKPPTPRITRASARRIAAKKKIAEKERTLLVQTQAISSPKIKKSSRKSKIVNGSFAPDNHQFKAPSGLPTLHLFGREALNEMKTDRETVVPIYFSPYVVSARDKRAFRKEQRHNLELGVHTSKETKADETNMQPQEKSDHEGELRTSYFRIMVQKEVSRLKALCQHWMIVKTDDSISEDSKQLISQAIGQTNLFIDKKVEQFKRLIVDCEFGTGIKLVTCQDLQGFWDMMYMQVEDCDSRFNKLVKLKERNWEEEKPTIVRNTVATKAKKPAAMKKINSTNSSSIRDAIRAARRKQIESKKTKHLQDTIISESSSETSADSLRLTDVKFDAGFVLVQSPKKIFTPKSVRKSSSMQQQPEFSEKTQRRRSARVLMNVSQKSKPEIKLSEVEGDSIIAYVNYQQTPGRSILKRKDVIIKT